MGTPGLLVPKKISQKNAFTIVETNEEEQNTAPPSSPTKSTKSTKSTTATTATTATTDSMCFSPGVEDGSLKLPWGSSLVTAQLDLFDVFTRQLAQILSVRIELHHF